MKTTPSRGLTRTTQLKLGTLDSLAVTIKDPTPDEAKRLVNGPLGKEMRKIASSYAAPLFWPIHQSESGVEDQLRNGTVFFLDCGAGTFGVTAGHVYDGFCSAPEGIQAQIGISSQFFDLRDRLIARGRKIDVATFRVTSDEIAQTGVQVLTGYQKSWPPSPPEVSRGVMFAGWPGVGRSILAPRRVGFDGFVYTGVASNVTDTDVVCVFEREYFQGSDDLEIPPPGFDLAGISGAPLLTVVQGDVFAWRLGGVVYECGRDLIEMVRAVRADFIREDGRLTG